MAIKVHSSFAMPAGVWLKEAVIIPEKVRIGELAKNLDISRQTLSAILNGRLSLPPYLAVRMETVLGISANTLMRMQGIYEMVQAQEAEKSFKAPRMIQTTQELLNDGGGQNPASLPA